ncbi:hypothetical protein L3X38_012195 [Prunus dulcis]|uniref:Uncharacterized protein n=1 Tax=Prunus dulcis TaxID=3755 RepID=A0AAD4ZGE6_PRUDU|nr:hypothetical protein L3X38_012195 [Prunus dulcis]
MICTSVASIRPDSKTFWISKHILEQLAARWKQPLICELNGILNQLIDLLMYGLQLLFSGQIVLKYVFFFKAVMGSLAAVMCLLICQIGTSHIG